MNQQTETHRIIPVVSAGHIEYLIEIDSTRKFDKQIQMWDEVEGLIRLPKSPHTDVATFLVCTEIGTITVTIATPEATKATTYRLTGPRLGSLNDVRGYVNRFYNEEFLR